MSKCIAEYDLDHDGMINYEVGKAAALIAQRKDKGGQGARGGSGPEGLRGQRARGAGAGAGAFRCGLNIPPRLS